MAVHPRAIGRGARVVDPAHWQALPDGHTRAVTTGESKDEGGRVPRRQPQEVGSLASLLRVRAAQIQVATRPLSFYDQIARTPPAAAARIQEAEDPS